MREISNIEISVLVGKLKQVEGSYIDKFYDLGSGRFVLKLSRKDFKANVMCLLSHTLHITAYTEKYGEPSNFAVAVRKRVGGYQISGISKVNDDRIVRLSLSKGESHLGIVFEMFGKGNMILVDQEDKILLAYAYEDFKGRSIRPRAAYKPPENLGIDILASSKEEAKNAIRKHSDMGIMSFMSRWTNVGTLYVENAISSLGIDPKEAVGKLGAKVWSVIGGIDTEVAEAEKGNAHVYVNHGTVADYALCSIKKYADMDVVEFDDIHKAMDFIYVEKAEKVEVENPALEKLKKSIDKQKRIVAGIDEQISRNKAIAQAIFNNMNVLNQIIDAASHNKRITADELNALLEDTGLSVKSADLKSKHIIVDI
jgi:predicted ribosome quality control (RQC) complex YloA/Tae2 family protein